ncbi:MAG: hypothetical protein EOO01_16530 [Chitinophagaceae bacterium]|nr:MAG: hypothetical protein EOO01_16530 [Chitinophagaceae bacterium]
MNYELDTYMDALQFFPTDSDVLEVEKGRAFLVKKDIFRNLMWYTLPDSNKQYPLTIESVKKIKAQNREGIRPEALETAEVQTNKPREVEPEYADLVGQISLKSLEKTTRKRRDKEKSRQQNQRPGNRPQQKPEQQAGTRPQGQNTQRPPQQRPPQQKPGGQPHRGGQPRAQGTNPQAGNAPKQGSRPQGNRPQGNRPQGNRPQGNRPPGDRQNPPQDKSN